MKPQTVHYWFWQLLAINELCVTALITLELQKNVDTFSVASIWEPFPQMWDVVVLQPRS
jgi:PIN domain nuclease of toxin-antitoxin system